MNEDDKLKYELEKSFELRNLELNNFWKRAWFFGALVIALFTVYLKVHGENNTYSIYISFVLMSISLCQSIINRGSKYWQERWEYKVKNCESRLGIDVIKTEKYNNQELSYIHDCMKAKGENKLVKASRFSVSKLTILVWDILFIMFFLIWINNFLSIYWDLSKIITNNIKVILFHIIYIVYVLLFLYKSRIRKPPKKVSKEIKASIDRASMYTNNLIE